MSLKTHIMALSVILVTVLLGWQLVGGPKPAAPADPLSEHFIEIIRASWGLNCAGGPSRIAAANNNPNANATNPLRENNVLVKISNLCNGKTSCVVNNTPEELGTDIAPECMDKLLTVEYRCFSFDRPWSASAKNRGTIAIDCKPK